MRAIFFGTPDIAVPALDATAELFEVVMVVCQPDRPKGRGLELAAPPVKMRALERGLAVVQPTKLKPPEFAESMRGLHADIAVVIAYGRILPKSVLTAPRLGCVNLHASILPKYRGAAPITWAIKNGEIETGISLMQMDEGLDTGPVFSRTRIALGENTTAGELSEQLAACAAQVVRTDLPRLLRGELTAEPQNETEVSYARILEKADGWIDFRLPAKAVHDHIRAMTPWPSAYAKLGDRTFKFHSTRVASTAPSAPPGTIVVAHKQTIEVACASGAISVLSGQLEGKKILGARDLIAGRVIVAGEQFVGRADGS